MDVKAEARKQCRELLERAKRVWSEDEPLAKRYVTIARKRAMRHRIRLGSKDYCKSCGVPWVPGSTLRVRASGKTVLYICKSCNKVKRFPLTRHE